MPFRLWRFFSVVIVLSLLSACNSYLKPDRQPADAYARQQVAAGNYQGAAQAYWQLAQSTQAAMRESYQLTAIEYALQSRQLEQVQNWLSQITAPTPQSRPRVQLIQTQMALLAHKPEEAKSLLAQIQIHLLSANGKISYYYLQALSLEALKQNVPALYARLTLDPLLHQASAIQANHTAIWKSLQNLSITRQQQWPVPLPPDFQGWIALSLTSREPAAKYQQALQQWRAQHPQHPANYDIVGQLHNQPQQRPRFADLSQVSHIALFLPLSGKFARPAGIVRDGFISAWYADKKTSKPKVKLYDVNDNNVLDFYQQAVSNGAQMVVGPMGKKATAALISHYNDFPVPTLLLYQPEALQQPGTRIPNNLFQFSLSPVQEAQIVAQHAWSDGHRIASILVPEGTWGERLAQAFSIQWQSLGGSIVDSQFYNKKNLASPVRAIARSGADMVFVGAFASQGRRIKPQFRYYGAGGLPLYATSHLYEAEDNPRMDKDLNGIVFVDMPWVLLKGFWKEPNWLVTAGENNQAQAFLPTPDPMYDSLQQQWSERMYGSSKRLFAFGIDAYQVINYLKRVGNNRYTPVQQAGASGLLSLNNLGIVQRQLLRAIFKSGRALPLKTIQ
ncbi:penicillin-binding protein activator [Candidatus Venteria ishoeyi]|uniref:Penicillin-binding protein activator LpoA n=1 Tax=Candidatus Venteria ishoeyi TaxID=1899563 RepID=A0A1H6F649_9GAMM|nr:penicillin-binding protein activator [Candidatus Venteria ishoeyi]MDM8545279.1 penicillin-binding protein activator [Candidatus Venteria ishoeyi]SEH05602.1 Penicillin-binding protein activator LpoA precursor [Candidatus Venteria ishoeyi]